MDSTTQTPVGIERYAERSQGEAERLAVLQDHRAGLRPCDADLVSATLQAVELVDGAASALECAGTWSAGEIARLRMVANLLLALDQGRVDDYARWFSVADLPFMQSSEPRKIGRQVLRAVARTLGPEHADRLYEAADILTAPDPR